MKLVPTFFRTLHNLSWSGGAIDALTWRRLFVREFIASLALMLIGFIVFMPGMIIGWHLMTVVSATIGSVFTGSIIIWLIYQWVKINILRMRHLGIEKASHLIALYLLVYVGAGVAAVFKILFLKEGSLVSAHIAALFIVPSALLNGMLCFREKPFWASSSPLLKPLKDDMKGEKIAQFVFETYMWFIILRSPLDVIFLSH